MTSKYQIAKHNHNIAIDIVKCLACIMITNSHMNILYIHPYEKLATGGAIGDALFFFCSGFTLFLGRLDRFDNWYKRRLIRIYPTIFAWGILWSCFLGVHRSMFLLITCWDYWFISCILIFYIVLYFIRKYISKHLTLVLCLSFIVATIVYFIWERDLNYSMYGETNMKRIYFFIPMLIGAIAGKRYGDNRVILQNLKWKDIAFLILSIVSFYVFCAFKKSTAYNDLQIVSLLPLSGVVYYIYKLCASKSIGDLMNKHYVKFPIKVIGSLCLEVYFVQMYVFTDSLNWLFPLNLPINFVMVLCCAYILRCASRIFLQTFQENKYSWQSVFQLY